MLKIFVAIVLFCSGSLFAADLTKLDMNYPGSACTNLELYVYNVAKDSRDDKKEDVKYTKQRIEVAFDDAVDRKLHELINAPPNYFKNIKDYLLFVTDEIWELKDVSPRMLADIMRVNCENPYAKQDTDNFYSLKTIGKLRGWLK